MMVKNRFEGLYKLLTPGSGNVAWNEHVVWRIFSIGNTISCIKNLK